MTRVVTVKLTDCEYEILDALWRRGCQESLSSTIRYCLLQQAKRHGIVSFPFMQVKDERAVHRPRRSSKLCKLIGQRRKDDDSELA
jgi:hypothetical protein